MKRTALILAFGIGMSNLAAAADVIYQKEKLSDAKEKQVKCDLTFSEVKKAVIVTVASQKVAEIPYNTIDKFSYEYAKHRRIKQGAIVMVASLGAGAVVMLTKSKTHWLTIDYHEGDAAKELVIRMDKKDYKDIFSTIQAHTGKEVQIVQDSGKGKKSKH